MTKLLVTHKMEEKARVNKACCLLDFPCEAFLKLTTTNTMRFELDEGEHTQTIEQYNQWTQDGTLDVIPFLTIDRKRLKVIEHEGRHRALACIRAGIKTFTVAIYLYDGGKVYYESDANFNKRFLTFEDMPKEIIGQFRSVIVDVHDHWLIKDLWAAWNPKPQHAASEKASLQISVRAGGPIVIGYGWEQYNPAVESQIVFDCMQLAGISQGGLQVYLDPNSPKGERSLLRRVLKRLDVDVVEDTKELAVFKIFVKDSQSVYEPPDVVYTNNPKIVRKFMEPDIKELRLEPDRPHYPEFPLNTERVAPPGTMPQYKARPPATYQTIYTLPMWAWNN